MVCTASASSFLNNSEFSLTWPLAQNALTLCDRAFEVGRADIPDCPLCNRGVEETPVHAFYYCERVRPFWNHEEEGMARIDPNQLVLLNVRYVMDNVEPTWKGEKYVLFLVILAVATMVI